MNEKSTKKAKATAAEALRANYAREALGRGVRGKHYKQAVAEAHLVAIEPELLARFPNAKAVNAALRAVVKMADQVKTG